MDKAVDSLNEREAEVLRLLLGGHCAKSVAQQLGLSVHTVNERLRHARRKLGVSTSREAARLLAQAESENHKSLAPAQPQGPKFAVANGLELSRFLETPQPSRLGRGGGSQISLTPFTGGVFLMALIAATVILTNLGGGTEAISASNLAVGELSAAQAADRSASSSSPRTTVSPLPPAATDASDQLGQASPIKVSIEVDLMPFADTNSDGVVSPDEYRTFSEQGWTHVTEGKAEVRLAELDGIQQLAFVGIMPNADGLITRDMYHAAIPSRFRMLDQNSDSLLTADELNGKQFQGQAPPQL